MLHPSTYDDAVSVNLSAHGDGIRWALASIGVIMQRAPCMVGRCLADNWSTAWRRTLPTTPIIIVPLPKVRWANVQAVDVEFSDDLTYQKSLKSVNFWQSYWKNKRWTFFWGGHSVYTVYRTRNVNKTAIIIRFSNIICQLLLICFKVRRSKISDKTSKFLLNYSNLFVVHFLSGHSVYLILCNNK